MNKALRWFALGALAAAPLMAEVVNYQGRLRIDGAAFSGTGHFRFALIGADGTAVWNSGDVTVPVQDGRYAVRLGEAAGSMPITAQELASSRIRIWFQRDGKQWDLIGADVPLPAAGAAAAPAPVDQQAQILAELRAIHSLLAANNRPQQAAAPQAPAPPQIVTVASEGAPSLGEATAPLTMVEFADFQCPFCVRFEKDVLPQLKAKYVSTGKLRLVSRRLPLPFHNFAAPAAQAAVCADEQGKFWAMSDRLYSASSELSAAAIDNAATAAGLDGDTYKACMVKGTGKPVVQADGDDAKAAGITGTPTFVLGRAVGGKLTGIKIVGAMPLADFEAQIDRLLAEKKG